MDALKKPLFLIFALVSQIKNSTQLDAALSFLSNAGLESFELDKFEEACGVRTLISYFL